MLTLHVFETKSNGVTPKGWHFIRLNMKDQSQMHSQRMIHAQSKSVIKGTNPENLYVILAPTQDNWKNVWAKNNIKNNISLYTYIR